MIKGAPQALGMRHIGSGLAHLLHAAQECDRIEDPLPGWMFRLALCERIATTYIISAGRSIPPLARTREYAAEFRKAGWPEYQAELKASLDRTLPVPGRQVTVLLDELLLARHVGGAAVMAGQVGHLIDQAESRAASILVVPPTSDTHVPASTLGHLLLPGDLSLFTEEDSDCVSYSAGPDASAERKQLVEALLDAALPQPQSLDQLREIRDKFSRKAT
ncbi:Scr1 family TA system antitoxin-like transcriptional regulator [Streptomyces sp. WM6378]|uniref:Scr1 family TA system antitoxin-like transcriptional regulator n=1 Tax=Streptomyces sp. WM6378 TaxID=1415557 RepID=UPI0006B022D0|nr:Scr1 family TA system antitoxin-like transcriptional regulator [Streptomyces sp. WM6378]KOU50095.1 hypothetical protein ADK54_10055 [Streptomyces sp. WM6378]